MERSALFSAKGITKRFPGVTALDDVSFDLYAGEVFGLVGENGAGKSTFIKVMSGIYQTDEGSLEMNGQPIVFHTPKEAFEHGISVVHQELSYVPELTIAENIMLAQYPMKHKNFMIDWKTLYKNADEALARIDIKLDPRLPIKKCSTAQKQLVEIAKAVYWESKIVILDEPTSALNIAETEKMLAYIRKLAKEHNLCIVYITHKLDEIFQCADRVAVLRDGRHITTLRVQETDKKELTYHMVGRTLNDMYPKSNTDIGEVIMEVRDLDNGECKDISFNLHKHEILGIYGMMGSGHIELGQMLFGDHPYEQGTVLIEGRETEIKNPIDAMKNGFAYVPSERKTEGLILDQSVERNLVVVHYQKVRDLLVDRKYDAEAARRWIDRIHIKAPSAKAMLENLSGGNQQKVVLAKWLDVKPSIFILVDPTRGIDVGSKAEIYELMDELCAQGMSVIMITSEMPELIAMADRALIMCEGRIQEEFNRDAFNQEDIVRAAIGGV